MTCKVDGCWGECADHNSNPFKWAIDFLKNPPEPQLGPNYIVVSPQQYAKLKSLFSSQVKFESYTGVNLGLTALKYEGKTILANKYASGSEIKKSAE